MAICACTALLASKGADVEVDADLLVAKHLVNPFPLLKCQSFCGSLVILVQVGLTAEITAESA